MAEYSDTDFDHVDFEPIILKDTEGVEHEFHFTVRHLGDRIGIDSFEIKDGHRGGYEFSLIGGIDKEIFDLFGKLFERMRRGLNRDHLEWSSIINNLQISMCFMRGSISLITVFMPSLNYFFRVCLNNPDISKRNPKLLEKVE